MRIGKLLGLAAACGGIALAARGADEALNPPAPLLQRAESASPAKAASLKTAADWALAAGFSLQAADFYAELLALPNADRTGLTLARATALLEGGRAEEARKTLAALPEPHNAGWHLRAGLAALQLRDYNGVRAELTALKEPELPPADYPWYWFLQGAYVDIFSPQETTRANDFYHRAENAAPNELALARFKLASHEVRLWRGQVPTPDELKVFRDNFETNQGKALGYSFARTLALGLVAQGQRNEAMTFLQTRVLPLLPPQEKPAWDDFRLLLGLIGDRGRAFAARQALSELLERGSSPERQRQALQLLWEAAQNEIVRGQLRALLDRLTGGTAKHPIRDSLLLYRAQLALVEKNLEQANASATTLLAEFPGSELRPQVYGLLTQVAWEQRRYRAAADNARKARTVVLEKTRPEDALARAELGVVEAEAYFRAGDFRNAADAYAATLREPPASMNAGDLMFQRVLAEIKAGSTDTARVLDELERDPRFDLESQWQAEWHLARAWLAEGKVREAFERVTARIEGKGAGDAGTFAQLKPELRARMVWLQMWLSLEAQRPEHTVTLADALLASLPPLDPKLAGEIRSTTLLRKGRAELQLRREAAALATLEKVRADFPDSEAAIQSYLIEADFYADQGKIVPAQGRLIKLIETPGYAKSPFIADAYFQLARWSEQLGTVKDLEDAYRHMENLVRFAATTGSGAELNDLVFAARMKEGDLLRRLNQFPQAQQIYESLKAMPTTPENAILARYELAKTHAAQAVTDPSQADKALLLFEELRDRVGAPMDVRVEAGYTVGLLLKAKDKPDQAVKAWMADVIVPFLEKAPRAELGAKQPFWLARTLVGLGEVFEQQGRLNEAREAYELLLRKNLGWDEYAAARLAQLAVRQGEGKATTPNE